MRGERARTKKGPLRKKRNDAEVGPIEKKYGVDFETRSDTKLKTVLKKKNVPTLTKLIKLTKGKNGK